ncbi:MAG TPA: DNA repair protein RecN [Fibrobacteraceae bacterium]|nr:DNA repair protein RecN [Fibrobacteraceae bacterium]
MLKRLRIQNLALIESADISFAPGFCAVTGETGAGKSVFLTGLRLCAGERSPAQMIRHGAEKATVEAVFQVNSLPQVLSRLEAWGVDSEDGEIVIQRELLAGGKSRARINGSLISQANLSELGDLLVQFHGQSEQVFLRDVRTHLQLLDAYGNHEALLTRYQETWKKWQTCLQEENALRQRAAELAQQKEFLQFQAEELGKAHLVADEDVLLESRLAEASGQEHRQKHLDNALDILDGEQGFVDRFPALQKALNELGQGNSELAEMASSLEQSGILFQELLRNLRKADKGGAGPSPAEIERINARIALLQRLQRKYHTTLEGLIELYGRRRQELSTLENIDAELAQLAQQSGEWREKMRKLGEDLHAQRQVSAKRMDASVQNRIQSLGMDKAEFTTAIQLVEPGPQGMDQVEFLMSPNAGEGYKTLRQAVSGGELSRVLLAFKSVLANRDRIPVLVFDEVDSGISGEVAHRIGECLHELGTTHQVLTITHLHQVACRAHQQLQVAKHESAERTFTEIIPLDGDGRVTELARMLGDPKSPTVLEHARQLLQVHHGQ